jgi:hypothetical protein
MSLIHFDAQPQKIDTWTIILLPKSESVKLPSRGMVLVEGTINNNPITLILEPDGKGSHWFRVDQATGGTVAIKLEPSKNWPEPDVPTDIAKGLAADTEAYVIWKDITPMARWDWIRWIRSTKNPQTRQHHIEVTCSKLKNDIRRPCCFNRSMCTEPAVSKNGLLIDLDNRRLKAAV